MKRRSVILWGMMFILLASTTWAQKITHQQFHDNEWQMKSRLWQYQKEHQNLNLVFDQVSYDVKYCELHLNVTNVSQQILTGVATMTSLAQVHGTAIADYNLTTNMIVDSVIMNGAQVSFTRPADMLQITLDRYYSYGQYFTTTVYYHGHPDPSGFGSFTWDTHYGQPIISTLSEPEGARDWWPCKDLPHDKIDSTDVYITCASNLTGISNGLMVDNHDNGDNTRTCHWHISYPISTYLICMAVSNYQSFTDWYVGLNGDSMPVTNYVYPELYNQSVEDFNIAPAALGIYAGLFGEYPFFREKFGYTLFPWNGGMEHQDNVFYGSGLISGGHWYDWITVHEMAHQWFGDAITCDTWPDVWLNEGFASYCEALYYEHLYGLDYYINYELSDNGVSDPSGPIYNPSDLFSSNTVYNKGSWVLHMLRGVMGDSAFFQGMYAFANSPEHQYGTATTRQFQHAMEPFYGDSLGWYFDEWVWGQNRPTYRYSWIKQSIGAGQYAIYLHTRQLQTSPAPNVFTMPIKIYATIGGVDTILTIWNDARTNDYRLVVNGNPSAVDFDKKNWILRNVAQETYQMNIVTLTLADGMESYEYIDTVEARGGVLPYHFDILSGNFPSGLVINGTSGIISGIPTVPAVDTFTARCIDSSSPSAYVDNQTYVVTIARRPGCPYIPGDSNGDDNFNAVDVTFSVNYLKGRGPTPSDSCLCGTHGMFYAAADVNGDCEFNAIDVTYSVLYLKGLAPEILSCVDCPPLQLDLKIAPLK